jgi:hypothetical protein
MPAGLADLVTAVGLLFVMEGLLLALFPDLMKRLVAEILTWPPQVLRVGGVAAAAAGTAIVWMIRG